MFLSVLALVLGVGGTLLGAARFAPNMTGYEFIPASGGNPDKCIARSVNCDRTSSNFCTLNSHVVADDDTQTSCGQQLKKP